MNVKCATYLLTFMHALQCPTLITSIYIILVVLTYHNEDITWRNIHRLVAEKEPPFLIINRLKISASMERLIICHLFSSPTFQSYPIYHLTTNNSLLWWTRAASEANQRKSLREFGYCFEKDRQIVHSNRNAVRMSTMGASVLRGTRKENNRSVSKIIIWYR